MPSAKKSTSSKRTPLPRAADFAKCFLKDWEKISNSGQFDMKRLKEVMLLLIANDQPLPPEWRDHALKGEWEDHRECHVGGDFLLIYRLERNEIVFVRAGTHATLF
jgi:mRNA interferase YafQ